MQVSGKVPVTSSCKSCTPRFSLNGPKGLPFLDSCIILEATIMQTAILSRLLGFLGDPVGTLKSLVLKCLSLVRGLFGKGRGMARELIKSVLRFFSVRLWPSAIAAKNKTQRSLDSLLRRAQEVLAGKAPPLADEDDEEDEAERAAKASEEAIAQKAPVTGKSVVEPVAVKASAGVVEPVAAKTSVGVAEPVSVKTPVDPAVTGCREAGEEAEPPRDRSGPLAAREHHRERRTGNDGAHRLALIRTIKRAISIAGAAAPATG